VSDTFTPPVEDANINGELFGDQGQQGDNQEPEPTSAPAPKAKRRRPRPSIQRSAEPMYSVADVAKIIEFTNSFEEAEEHDRERYITALGFPDRDVDGLRAATALSTFPTDVAGFRLFTQLAYDAWDGKLDFVRGIALVGIFGDADPAAVQSAITFANAVLPDDKQLDVKRNAAAGDIVMPLGTALITLDEGAKVDARRFTDWVGGLVATWPGE